jgi:hypothetical protein
MDHSINKVNKIQLIVNVNDNLLAVKQISTAIFLIAVIVDFQFVWMFNGANIGAAPVQGKLNKFSPPNFQIPDF